MHSWLISLTTSKSENLISEEVSYNESDLGSVLKPNTCPLLKPCIWTVHKFLKASGLEISVSQWTQYGSLGRRELLFGNVPLTVLGIPDSHSINVIAIAQSLW